MAKTHQYLISVEDNIVSGGAGSAVAQFLSDKQYQKPLKIIGLPDEFIKHGTQQQIYHLYQLDAEGLEQQITDFINSIRSL
jgi:1-deoxy-D-xylulose-5-phosphate synthase